jgi:hypothetical protein
MKSGLMIVSMDDLKCGTRTSGELSVAWIHTAGHGPMENSFVSNMA